MLMSLLMVIWQNTIFTGFCFPSMSHLVQILVLTLHLLCLLQKGVSRILYALLIVDVRTTQALLDW